MQLLHGVERILTHEFAICFVCIVNGIITNGLKHDKSKWNEHLIIDLPNGKRNGDMHTKFVVNVKTQIPSILNLKQHQQFTTLFVISF